ncbi:glycosyltransferase family 4 protein [Salinarimonas soli]|uniref:Glycosyltransferase family 4 protein n=1 Tax=Salinarimonas soli TaxID=1638099 RepID=A0A5B2VF91_9HYPH|nr:glycosyltransferase family 4 protein [Salinarimonas soli]KAA2238233.1 glycosyltransferase family 4 protein [Salinarimonas soli]
MKVPSPVAFYPPLKSPRHPTPSGDRTMARLLMAALERAGARPELMSELRTFEPAGDPRRQAELREAGLREAERIVAQVGARPPAERPRAWFTYHVYYKAPDWIGPAVAGALGIPYLVAEGSRAGKRAGGPWAIGHEGAEAALDRADAILVLTGADREALERHRPAGQRLVDLPPFLDTAPWTPRVGPRPAGPARLVTVAMMRHGDKLASYRLLAAALGGSARDWTLDVIGDGEARPEVEAAFAGFGTRVRFLGRRDDRSALAAELRRADLFVWPAVNEAYGLALLEAQACGVPVLAGAFGGVADVVRDGHTGLLVRPGDAGAFTRALDSLLADPDRLAALSRRAAAFVHGERGLGSAAARLAGALEGVREAACA